MPWDSIVEHPLLPLLGAYPRPAGRVDNNQLRGHAAHLTEESLTLAKREMPVEVAGQNSVKGAVAHR